MSEFKDYKCPNCGGALNFDSKLQKMKCPYCESVFEMEQFQQMDEELNTNENTNEGQFQSQYSQGDGSQETASQGQTSWREEELEGMRVYLCRSCGAEIIGNETMGASTCPYCGNQIVIKEVFSGDLRPDYVIPFKLDKKEALNRLQSYLNGKKLLPPIFKDQHHIEEIKAMYVPYWLFDATAHADMRYETMKMTGSWTRGDYRYEEFSHFEVIRRGSMDFQYVPMDGSKRMPDDLMESLEPYDMKDAVDFQTAYLAGYLADRYDVTQEESVGRIKQRVENSVHNVLEDTVRQFGSIQRREGRVDVKQTNVKYALFPVWLLNTSWNGQIYTFAMNGQTGRFIGNLPVDKRLARLALLKRTILYGIVIGIGTFLFLMW